MNIELTEPEVEAIIAKHFSDLLLMTPLSVVGSITLDPEKCGFSMSVACEYETSVED